MTQLNWSDPPSQTAFPVAKAGYPFIFASAFATAVFALLGVGFLAMLGLLATGFICWFFRDPDRLVPVGEGVIVSPADGKVVKIEPVAETPYYPGACTRVSVFMSIFNVHVNRSPHEGTVRRVNYYPGKFFPPISTRPRLKTSTTPFCWRARTASRWDLFKLPAWWPDESSAGCRKGIRWVVGSVSA